MRSARESLLKQFEGIQRGTEFVLRAIPGDKLNHRVEEGSTSIGQLAFHISTLPLGSALFAQGVFDKFPETDALIAEFNKYLGDSLDNKDYEQVFSKSCKVFLDFFGSRSDEEFVNDTFESFLTRGPRTYLEGFLAMQNHLLQHRGSLTSTLRSAGIKVGLQQYWGMKPLD